MESLLPSGVPDLEDLARGVVSRRLRLVVNSIEGYTIHPVDIERAMCQDYLTDSARRDL